MPLDGIDLGTRVTRFESAAAARASTFLRQNMPCA